MSDIQDVKDITTLMVCTYNRLELSKRMMNSLLTNTNSPFRIVVIDNGSQDGTSEWLPTIDWQSNAHCVGFEYQLNETNRGIAIGRNQCLKLSNKYNDPYLSTLDNDVEFTKNWLGDCVDIIKANPKMVVGLNMESTKYPVRTMNGKRLQCKPAGNCGTAVTVFNRALHTQIGYFITDYGLYSCEDSDYFFRARKLGYGMGYLEEMGLHIGEGENDRGEYREFKDQLHAVAAPKFRLSCSEYLSGKRPLFIDFKE